MRNICRSICLVFLYEGQKCTGVEKEWGESTTCSSKPREKPVLTIEGFAFVRCCRWKGVGHRVGLRGLNCTTADSGESFIVDKLMVARFPPIMHLDSEIRDSA